MNKVAIYCRLSDEDRDKQNKTDESESIQNQKSMLLAYVVERGWDLYKIYCDEDYSGADKNRPEWNGLIADAKDKKFNIVLCKTQSRFSRDMEMIERYIHGKFIEWGIRFVSIVDNADTAVVGNKKSRQINGLINEWYLEDLSDNIRRTLDHKKQNGEWVGSFAPYGYMEDPKNRNHLVIDPVAADVVKKVFVMYLDGLGYISIAKKLNETGISNPSTYKRDNGSKFKTKSERITSNVWTNATIYQMIRREVYTGTLVQSVTENISYKNKKRRKNSPNDWIRTPNAHEAIIDIETWNAVQEKLKSKKRAEKVTGEVHIFAGKIFCSICKNTMWKMSYQLKNGRYQYFKCRTRTNTDDLCDNASGMRLDTLANTVKDEINKLLDEFYCSELIKLSSVQNNNGKINALKAEQQDILRLTEKKQRHLDEVYNDKLEKLITAEQFSRQSDTINKEILQYQNRINGIETELAQLQGIITKNNSKEILLNKYRRIEVLDRNLADEFIEAIYVGKVENNIREIEIKWKF